MSLTTTRSSILVIEGHPDGQSFVGGLARAYAEGARAAGSVVETVRLADLRFDPVLHGGFHGEQPLEPDLVRVHEAILRAGHVAFAFPTWWAAPPALVKGFVDRTFLPGVAFRFEPGASLPTGLFAGRSARLITTMDSPSWWYRLKHGRAVHRSFISATLDFVGFAPVASRTVYKVRELDEAAREAALRRASRDGARDAAALHARGAQRRVWQWKQV
ncbi:MAG: NAD(P)H-dependent oxidoreductase [Polyangiales bacterium]